MLNKILIAIALFATLITMVACSSVNAQQPERNPVTQEISINSADEFSQHPQIQKEITLNNGDQVTITLVSNATTGFSWNENAAIADTTVMQQLKHENIAGDSGKLGAAGAEKWTFKALKVGTTNAHLEYSRPWEGGEKGVWIFDLKITVK
jgi:inhibitor of cysteine peptidase